MSDTVAIAANTSVSVAPVPASARRQSETANPAQRAAAFLSNASVMLSTISVSTRGLQAKLKLPQDVSADAAALGQRLDELHTRIRASTRSPSADGDAEPPPAAVLASQESAAAEASAAAQQTAAAAAAAPPLEPTSPLTTATAAVASPTTTSTKRPASLISELVKLAAALHATPPPAIGTTASAVVTELHKMRRHGRELVLLVTSEIAALFIDAVRGVNTAALDLLTGGVADVTSSLRGIMETVALEHYSLKTGIQLWTAPPNEIDTALRQMLKVSLDTIKALIRCASFMQDLGRASDSARTVANWVSALDTIALPTFFLVHAAAYETPANGLPPAIVSSLTKTRSDARSLLYQLIGLAVKQSPTTRCAAPSAAGWTPAELKASFGSLSALHPLLDAVARCVGESDSVQTTLCLRILSDSIVNAATEDAAALRWLVATPRYSKSIFTALLAGCIGASSTVALAATLRAVASLLKVASVETRQELGFLHCNAVLRLLDSDNTAAETRDTIVRHLASIAALEITSPATSPLDRPAQKRYLLVDLFAYLDLDPRLHHANFVTQVVTSLSRVARTRGADLSPAAVAAAAGTTTPNPAASSGGAAASTPKSETANSDAASNDSNAASVAPSTTLGHAALLALNRITETMALAAQQELLVSCNSSSALAASSSSAATPAPSPSEGEASVQPAAAAVDVEPKRWVYAPLPVAVSSLATEAVQRLRAEKLALQRHVDIFNLKPEKLGNLWGIKQNYCADVDLAKLALPANDPFLDPVEDTDPVAVAVNKYAHSIADFLLHTPSLNPASIGEYLSDRFPVPVRAAYYFMTALQLRGRPVAAALGELFLAVSLPREGQKVERLLEAFSNAYWDANKDNADTPAFPFKNSDATFVLVVATVMLHTDLHNPRVSSKMTKASFQAQLSRCNDNEDFPPGFATEIFDTIAAGPFNAAKGIGAGAVEGQAPNSTQIAQQSKMDFFFFSKDERKELLFTLERRRTFLETKELVLRRAVPLKQQPVTAAVEGAVPPFEAEGFLVSQLAIPNLVQQPPTPEATPTTTSTSGAADAASPFTVALSTPPAPQLVTYAPITKELFSATWGTMFAAFSVILQQDSLATSAPPSAPAGTTMGFPVAAPCLQNCVKGLQDLLFVAAAHGAVTEAEAALTALLRVPRSSAARQLAVESVFFVAASPFSVNLNTSSWTAIASLCAETHYAISQGTVSPSLAAMTLDGVYRAIESSLSPSTGADAAVLTKRADVVLNGVVAALTASAHADVAALVGLLTVLRSVLKAFAAADLSPVNPTAILAESIDTLTGLFVSLFRWANNSVEASAAVAAALEAVIALCIGVQAIRAERSAPSSAARLSQRNPFDIALQCYACVLVTQPSSSASGGGSTPTSGSSGSLLGGALRVKTAVVRCIQRLAAAFGSQPDDTADPSVSRRHVHGEFIFAKAGQEPLFLSMLQPITDAIMTPGSGGPAEELRILASVALRDLSATACSCASSRGGSRQRHSALTILRVALVTAIAAPTSDVQNDCMAMLSNVAVHFVTQWTSDLISAEDSASDAARDALFEDFTTMLIKAQCVALRATAMDVRHSALATMQWLCVQLAAMARGVVPPCVTSPVASPLLGRDRQDHNDRVSTPPPTPPTSDVSGITPVKTTAPTKDAAALEPPRSPGLAPSNGMNTAKRLARQLLVVAAQALAHVTAEAAVQGHVIVGEDIDAEFVEPLGAALMSPVRIEPKLALPGAISTTATFPQLLTFVSMDLLGNVTGPNRELPPKSAPIPPPLPWHTAQEIASIVLRDALLVILRKSTVSAKGHAAKAITRTLDRSLAAFSSSPAAHSLTSSIEEAEFVLGVIGDALEAVVIPPTHFAPFIKTDASGNSTGVARLFYDAAAPFLAPTAAALRAAADAGGETSEGDDHASSSEAPSPTATASVALSPSSSAADGTVQDKQQGSGRSTIHVTPAEASDAYHALSCVTNVLATYAANVAHRAAPLPETDAARRLVLLLLRCADDCITLHDKCPALASSLEFAALKNRPLYQAPPLVFHWTLTAAVRLLFSRWRHAPTAVADEEHCEELALHAVTLLLFEYFAQVSRVNPVPMQRPAPQVTRTAANGITHITTAPAPDVGHGAGGIMHSLKPPIAEVIREWGCMISASDKGFAAASLAGSPTTTISTAAGGAAVPPQWRVLRRSDVFRAAVGSLMVAECPPKVVGAVAKYLTLFHSAELVGATNRLTPSFAPVNASPPPPPILEDTR